MLQLFIHEVISPIFCTDHTTAALHSTPLYLKDNNPSIFNPFQNIATSNNLTKPQQHYKFWLLGTMFYMVCVAFTVCTTSQARSYKKLHKHRIRMHKCACSNMSLQSKYLLWGEDPSRPIDSISGVKKFLNIHTFLLGTVQ